MYAYRAMEIVLIRSSSSSPLFSVFFGLYLRQHMKMPRSRLRWKYTEGDMAEAILDVTDNGFSPPQAAHRRGVPPHWH